MILANDTNTVYFSKLIETSSAYASAFKRLASILDKHHVNYKFIASTKDIWCRDYMPVQLSQNEFVQFRYEPSYLQNDLHLQSDPHLINDEMRFTPTYSNINFDAGNIVHLNDRAIISDRVFDENPEYSSKSKLVTEIEKLLRVEVIIIPQIKSDMTGHADGLVRFVDSNTILGNNRMNEYKYWRKGMEKALSRYSISYIDVPFFVYKDKRYADNAIGCYVNYLEVGNLIVLPIFEIDGNRDFEVYDLIKQVFPDRIIETVNINEVGLEGGLLNCITWTIKE